MTALLLIPGLVLAAVGGDRFVRGTVGLALWMRIPAGIVGATIAAFATSSPELTVGVLASVDGRSELAFGDATGSNIVNTSVVLGIALLLGGMTVRWRDIGRELVTFLGALVVIGVSTLDGRIEVAESIGILILFTGWLTWVVRTARRQRSDMEVIGETQHRAVIVDVILGLVMLVVSGRLIVLGSKEIGEFLGWNSFVVGTVVVAIGTSAPELVTTLIAARRGHVEIGLGAVLGSNIFNSLFIVGIAGLIDPIRVDRGPTFVALVAALLSALLLLPGRKERLDRGRGGLLIGLYGAFLAVLLVVQG